jgi:N-acetylglucosaminyldiphosphoundecaprenol N-acetyl-beta-D-mannosaminyltransferase
MNAMADTPVGSRTVLGIRVDATDYDHAVEMITNWSRVGEGRCVCVLTVHSVMEAYDAPALSDIMNESSLNTPDGMPLVWSLKALGVPHATRVYGPELMARLLGRASRANVPVGFYGGHSDVALRHLVEAAEERFTGLNVAYAWSPPFRPLTEEEDARVCDEITSSGARILLVGLGCPKQEYWMAAHRSVPLVMIGVGAAFDFLAGLKPQAPAFIQKVGLEWLFRLIVEPRRLWKRYLKHNPRFVALMAEQLLHLRNFD